MLLRRGSLFRAYRSPGQPWHPCRATARPSTRRNTPAPTSSPLRRQLLAAVAVDGASEVSSGTYRSLPRRSIASGNAPKMSPKWPHTSVFWPSSPSMGRRRRLQGRTGGPLDALSHARTPKKRRQNTTRALERPQSVGRSRPGFSGRPGAWADPSRPGGAPDSPGGARGGEPKSRVPLNVTHRRVVIGLGLAQVGGRPLQ